MSVLTTVFASGREIHLSSRDVSDAIRLLNLLQNSGGPEESSPLLARVQLDPASGRASEPSLKAKARAIFNQRRARAGQFKSSMFSEPAWDMLLALFALEDSERRLTVTQLAELSGAPLATGLRWITFLEDERLITRTPSKTDRRIMFIHITDFGMGKMTTYLESIVNLRT